MPENGNTVSVKVFSSINEVSGAEWDACAGSENPFVSHTFLKTLEDSLAVRAETGWLPQHVVIEDVSGKIIGASPCYLKNHSHGEYVFDWGWADAFERAGGRYYPKLQVSVPFSPVTGPRLLVRNGEDKKRTRQLLTGGLIELANQHSVSSLHITFALEDEWNDLGEMGLLQRKGQQFHWRNRNFKTFDEFLASLNSRKRKMIRKEREAANSAVKIEVLTGDTLTEHHMTAFYGFYLNTVDRKWAHAYLNHDFFQLLRERMSYNIVLVMAQDTNDYVAGALNLRGPTTLWGRNWGCTERFRMLYFEACFYRGIDFAIKNSLSRVEAGAQGPHKISRGYLPSETYSGHWIRDKN
ncbi:MAG: GNAT family N-acetyltransferase, partial [Pseudomonadota bacterium]|nr:GNAT family N-acetyltransferase [Pseudomonadota bacterium]